jgi:hypothetical protein
MIFFNNDLWKSVNGSILFMIKLLKRFGADLTASVYLIQKNHV